MHRETRKRVWQLAERLLSPAELEKVKQVRFADLGYGYDPFGMEMESAVLAFVVARLFHRYWFRVKSYGIENVPGEGAALLVANHSGVIPIDGAMMAVDMAVNMPEPRFLRSVIDYFAADLPFINIFMSRVGQVAGNRKNFEDLVRNGQLVGVFPEGTRGLGKPFSERYRLRRFNVGFIELSLVFRAPIVPVAVIGAEEQAPLLFNAEPIARLFGFPYFPVTPQFPLLGPLGWLPLPSKYAIYYDQPLEFFREYPPEAAKDAETVRMLADKVQVRIQEMIDVGLEQRKEIFGLGLSRYLIKEGHPDDA